MADAQKPTAADPRVDLDREVKRQEVLAKAEEVQLDETVPGGRYEVDGKLVDANGNELKDR